MATKTITIMEDAYEILAKSKRNGESFSDVIRRWGCSKKDIMDFAGAWKDSGKEYGKFMKEVKEYDKKARKKEEEKERKLYENMR